jgi:signal transduction histidine kinase
MNFCKGESTIQRYFQNSKSPLVVDELKYQIQKGIKLGESKRLVEQLESIKIALAVPLFISKKLIGFLALGPKQSGDPFFNQDIKLLEILSHQIALAIENARLYQNMEQEIERKTADLEEAVRKLRKISEAKTEFVSIASHQLRTPLTVIKGIASMMHEGDFGKIDELQKRYLTKILDSTDRLIKLVNVLLDVTKIEAGREKLDVKEIQLENIIKSLILELNNKAKTRGIRLEFKKCGPMPKIGADPERIRQVILNLLDNAINYTPKGKIEISLERKMNFLICHVSDTGTGISKEELPLLFKKFVRAKKGSKYAGFGLGLYIAKKIVEAHGGKIWVESKGKGKGSTFSFSLPFVAK